MSKTITVRGVPDDILTAVKDAARRRSQSADRFIVGLLQSALGSDAVAQPERHNMDQFIGYWDEKEYNRVSKAARQHRKIEKEMWQ
ncbi:MAG: hypothetical protein NTX50_15350 [Candidatus Sumerlaeota bacterium]|nr:hypothetical protein [Candidatus Sumerlaeota bacterium]